jgi:hypothetical protein
LACLFSSFLTCAPFLEGKMGEESDATGATLRFCEQMSQIASTGSDMDAIPFASFRVMLHQNVPTTGLGFGVAIRKKKCR